MILKAHAYALEFAFFASVFAAIVSNVLTASVAVIVSGVITVSNAATAYGAVTVSDAETVPVAANFLMKRITSE
jgi:hypothetical protein